MNNLISISNFTGEFQLTTGTFREPQFNAFIAQKQKDFLIQFLGIDLYEDIEINYEDDRWQDFFDGKKYLSITTGKNINFKGFKDFLTCAVYADWLDFSRSFITETGMFEPQNVNSEKALKGEVRNKSNYYWNIAVGKSKIIYDYLYSFSTTYESFYNFFIPLKIRADVKIVTLY